jgi:hypothetical protein
MLAQNQAAVTHGGRSRQALRKARESILERWRARYRGADGKVSPAVDSVLRQLARLEAVSDRCVAFSEKTQEPITSARHTAVHDRMLSCADRIARLQLVLADLAPEASVMPSRVSVVFGGRHALTGALTAGSTTDAARVPAADVAPIGARLGPLTPAAVPAIVDADVIPAPEAAPAPEIPPRRVLRLLAASGELVTIERPAPADETTNAPASESDAAARDAEAQRARAASSVPAV